jgi:hypothetical protein
MAKYWMRHGPGRVHRIDDGRAACPVHADGVPVEVCRACPRLVAFLHEGRTSSVLCCPASRQAGTSGAPGPERRA